MSRRILLYTSWGAFMAHKKSPWLNLSHGTTYASIILGNIDWSLVTSLKKMFSWIISLDPFLCQCTKFFTSPSMYGYSNACCNNFLIIAVGHWTLYFTRFPNTKGPLYCLYFVSSEVKRPFFLHLIKIALGTRSLTEEQYVCLENFKIS